MRIALTIVIIIVALAWLNQSGEEGTASDNLVKGLSQIRQLFDDNPLKSPKDKETSTIYKHRNADGELVFTDQPPKDGEKAESQTYHTDTNVIPALPARRPDQDKPSEPAREKSKQTDTKLSPLTPYTDPGKVLDLIRDAKNIENTLEQRKEKMDRQLENLQ